MSHLPLPEIQDPRSSHGGRWMVVIHNNEHNTFDDVIEVLMVATGCTSEEAAIEAWEAHHYGKASVHFAAEPECAEAAKIIEGVGVKTDVLPEWSD